MTALLDEYHARLERGELKADPEQEKAAVALQRLCDDLSEKRFFLLPKKNIDGVYMYGGVGRGKSMLMDMFLAAAPSNIKKRRVHFHAFMIETHDWLHARRVGKAADNILPDYASYVAANTRLLCFDEFHVTDVADAMILSRLFTALFEKGVVVVATSNWEPDRLYEGGLQRAHFLPFIALLKEQCEIVHLDGPNDYRAVALRDLETYLWPLNAATEAKADAVFRAITDGKSSEEMTLRVKGRDIHVMEAAGAARFTFAQLCEQPHGAEDYLKIAEEFHTVFLEGIPKMNYDRRNEVKRLMTLIDVLYDTRRRVIITADAPPEKLYIGHDYEFEFERTISRLNEMQSSSYVVS